VCSRGKKIGVILLLSVVLLTVTGGELYAQTPLPFDELGAGPKATAMGQAFTAVADDASAGYYNPAGLVQVRSPIHLTIGYQYAKPRVWIDMEPVDLNFRKGDYSRKEDLSTRGLYVGYVSNFADVSYFKDKAVLNRVALGFAMFANLPEINQFWNPQWDTEPYVLRYNERWSLFSMAISVGFRCTDWLSIGAGILPQVSALQTSTNSWIQLPPEPDDEAVGFRINLRQVTEMSVVPIAGVLIRPPVKSLKDILSIGFSYRGLMEAFYGTGMQSTKVILVFDPDNPALLFDDPGGLVVDHVGFSPEQMTTGIALKPFPNLLLSVDLTWKRYSAFTFFWDIPPELPFSDVWIPRVGIAYSLNPGFTWRGTKNISELSFLAGYYWEPSPVPDMSGRMNILDADQNVVSGGINLTYDVDWAGYLKLETYFQAHLMKENLIENDRDPLYGPIAVGGQVWGFGVALSIVY